MKDQASGQAAGRPGGCEDAGQHVAEVVEGVHLMPFTGGGDEAERAMGSPGYRRARRGGLRRDPVAGGMVSDVSARGAMLPIAVFGSMFQVRSWWQKIAGQSSGSREHAFAGGAKAWHHESSALEQATSYLAYSTF